MTVPTQRDEPSLSSVILATVQQVQASVERLQETMSTRFDALDQRFMPRDQVVNRFETVQRDHLDLRAQLDAAKTQHDTDVERLAERMVAQERARLTARRYAVATSIAALAAIVTLLGLILAHVH